jgi:hypothetical protein
MFCNFGELGCFAAFRAEGDGMCLRECVCSSQPCGATSPEPRGYRAISPYSAKPSGKALGRFPPAPMASTSEGEQAAGRALNGIWRTVPRRVAELWNWQVFRCVPGMMFQGPVGMTKTRAEMLREQAQRCRRLASQTTDREISQRLHDLAQKFDEEATLEATRKPCG